MKKAISVACMALLIHLAIGASALAASAAPQPYPSNSGKLVPYGSPQQVAPMTMICHADPGWIDGGWCGNTCSTDPENKEIQWLEIKQNVHCYQAEDPSITYDYVQETSTQNGCCGDSVTV